MRHAPCVRAGGGPESITQNCSGKHAGMLATSVINGWPTAGYLDPEHPRAAPDRRPASAREPAACGAIGVDGCGARPVPRAPRPGRRACRPGAARPSIRWRARPPALRWRRSPRGARRPRRRAAGRAARRRARPRCGRCARSRRRPPCRPDAAPRARGRTPRRRAPAGRRARPRRPRSTSRRGAPRARPRPPGGRWRGSPPSTSCTTVPSGASAAPPRPVQSRRSTKPPCRRPSSRTSSTRYSKVTPSGRPMSSPRGRSVAPAPSGAMGGR